MARNCSDEEKLEEDQEALSLSDLPINSIEQSNKNLQTNSQSTEENFNFDLGSLNGSISKESEMCIADDIFFQGQILPLRLSTSSDNGFTRIIHSDRRNLRRSLSRSGSTSFSSRSNSSGSSSNSLNAKPRNHFHEHPSPTPQMVQRKSRSINPGNRSQTYSMWDLFRLGLVRGPEIELQDFKSRNLRVEKKVIRERKGIMGDCKCSVETVESNVVIRGKRGEMLGRKKAVEKLQGKQDLSRHRTFEWLKELSFPNLD